jgi:fatty-acyl-CoA synthase
MTTFADHVWARRDDPRPALRFEDRSWTYAQWVQACAARAALFAALRGPGEPHVGVLLDNVPDFSMWLGAAALCGATVVGINPTRRGDELALDIRHTECQVLVTERNKLELLAGLDLGAARDRVLVVDEPDYADAVGAHASAPVPDPAEVGIEPATRFALIFTSGTSGAPKAVICTHGRLERVAATMRNTLDLQSDDITYCAMPMFHSNALFTAWAPTVRTGATLALRRRFSASEFLPDIRRFGATYFNYIGKPLAYVLATPPRPDDADNPLQRGFGNEASDTDLTGFTARFGSRLIDGYGQSETGASITRAPDMPPGSLGRPVTDSVCILDPDTGEECPRAEFDGAGRLLNAADATGEIVNTAPPPFEGYWKNTEAEQERLRHGWYWTGDLGYRDADGWFYYAGRSADWIRVDGENFAASPIDRIVMRYPDALLVAAYGVPDADAGDRVMVALQLLPDRAFDAAAFDEFLAAQADLGPKWRPTFVRVVDGFPMTETNKVVKRTLVQQRWDVDDNLWWRAERDGQLVPFTAADAAHLRERFDDTGRAHVLEV